VEPHRLCTINPMDDTLLSWVTIATTPRSPRLLGAHTTERGAPANDGRAI
jgi:hypothetical protein